MADSASPASTAATAGPGTFVLGPCTSSHWLYLGLAAATLVDHPARLLDREVAGVPLPNEVSRIAGMVLLALLLLMDWRRKGARVVTLHEKHVSLPRSRHDPRTDIVPYQDITEIHHAAAGLAGSLCIGTRRRAYELPVLSPQAHALTTRLKAELEVRLGGVHGGVLPGAMRWRARVAARLVRHRPWVTVSLIALVLGGWLLRALYFTPAMASMLQLGALHPGVDGPRELYRLLSHAFVPTTTSSTLWALWLVYLVGTRLERLAGHGALVLTGATVVAASGAAVLVSTGEHVVAGPAALAVGLWVCLMVACQRRVVVAPLRAQRFMAVLAGLTVMWDVIGAVQALQPVFLVDEAAAALVGGMIGALPWRGGGTQGRRVVRLAAALVLVATAASLVAAARHVRRPPHPAELQAWRQVLSDTATTPREVHWQLWTLKESRATVPPSYLHLAHAAALRLTQQHPHSDNYRSTLDTLSQQVRRLQN